MCIFEEQRRQVCPIYEVWGGGGLDGRRWETEQKENMKLNSGYLLQLTSALANQLLDMSFVSEYQSAV